ncbi:UNVERIFIED_CONTAM: Sodium channel modifier 1 [Sesamum radiatum]|uniref:Sodium channel modifier 1 n=1 Tax=Sesamum radiatum TaxID=300843 RepID=A0AAW2MV49_SESRA
MSVFGGDSWAREAHYRKRRVDDLIIEGVEASAYKKLPNGKFACIICPNNPVLDTPIMLSICVNTKAKANASVKQRKSTSRPLIERARKAASEVFPGGVDQPEMKSAIGNLVASCGGDSGSNGNSIEIEGMHKGLVREMQPIDYRERQERELKFTAAGWKRDCHGRWFKDENVEFDSDEEDPNIVFKQHILT